MGSGGAFSRMSAPSAILVRKASTHNLKAIDCRIPHGKVTVVTGPSGAGKSSLAFDTVFAEGQRRFVESMSTYARQFLDQMERPPVEAIEHIPPAVALEAKNAVRNARSTVGTITEVHDVLRLLYTHLGTVRCPHGHGEVRRLLPTEAADLLTAGEVGEAFLLVARLPRPARGADAALGELVRQGLVRRMVEPELGPEAEPAGAAGTAEAAAPGAGSKRRRAGRAVAADAATADAATSTDTSTDSSAAATIPAGQRGAAVGLPSIERLTPESRWLASWVTLPLVIGRFRAGDDPARLAAAVEEVYRLAGGRAEVWGGRGERRWLTAEPACAVCGVTVRRPEPALFSFNSPLGACVTCQGFGRIVGIDRARVVPDPRKSLREKPIAPWNTASNEGLYRDLLIAAHRQGISLDTPWEELTPEQREWVWSGKGKHCNLNEFFAWLEGRTYKVQARVLLARYRSYEPCPDCRGTRLKAEARAVELHGRTLPELCSWSIERLRAWLAAEPFSPLERARAGHLLDQLRERIEVLHRVGLDYLSLDRQARTLSGGETQRIHLAAALGSGMTSTLYVLDEPTIGLHPQDSGRLVHLLGDLAARGNTVLVVEHDRTVIAGADHVIDLGPAAGEHGGRVMAEGTLAEILESPDSLTARYLRERPPTHAREHLARFRREHRRDTPGEEVANRPLVSIRGARAHNLRHLDVDFPLASLVAVVGVSGSGKSTLVENVLYGNYQRGRGVVDVDPGPVDALEGLARVADVVMVDQSPLGRSTRSNPVTYVKAYDEIRKLFASTGQAKSYGITAGHFSFNLDLGRCRRCEGTGTIEVDMQFMAPVTVTCEECHGRRFRSEVLRVRLRDRTIADVLELTVDAALELFAEERGLCKKLRALHDVGLGYLRLGQSTSTLSGGEAQRLKLASFLHRPAGEGSNLFLFDEPTTGLHLADIDLLYRTLRRLVQRGDGVVVVEHSLDLVSRADWIVDLGPGGGSHGGRLLFSGPLEIYLDEAETPTARELRAHLRWTRPHEREEEPALPTPA
jgi:excinuclease ABC subunit A